MSVRHVYARQGEYIRVHRESNETDPTAILIALGIGGVLACVFWKQITTVIVGGIAICALGALLENDDR